MKVVDNCPENCPTYLFDSLLFVTHPVYSTRNMHNDQEARNDCLKEKEN
jgi:hypothetical protein